MSGVSHSGFFLLFHSISTGICFSLLLKPLKVAFICFLCSSPGGFVIYLFFLTVHLRIFRGAHPTRQPRIGAKHTVPPEHLHNEPEEAHPEETFARTGSEYSPHCHVNIASSILLGLPHLKGRPRKHKRHRLHITYHCVRKEVRAELTFTSSIISCVGLLHSECRWCHL